MQGLKLLYAKFKYEKDPKEDQFHKGFTQLGQLVFEDTWYLETEEFHLELDLIPEYLFKARRRGSQANKEEFSEE